MIKIFRYWLPVLFFLSLIFYLSSIPAGDLPSFSFLNFKNSDKVVHFCIYLVLGFCLFRALTAKQRGHIGFRNSKMTLLITFIFGSIYGISDELHQYFVPGRSVEFLDWVADTLGSTSGAILSMFYRRWQSR